MTRHKPADLHVTFMPSDPANFRADPGRPALQIETAGSWVDVFLNPYDLSPEERRAIWLRLAELAAELADQELTIPSRSLCLRCGQGYVPPAGIHVPGEHGCDPAAVLPATNVRVQP